MSATDLSNMSQEHLLASEPNHKFGRSLTEISYRESSPITRKLKSSFNESAFGATQTESQILRNMVILGLGFVFVFSSLNALQCLQSSLFIETGLGLKALAILYISMIVSCLYGPVFVQQLTPNWTIVLSFVMGALFISTFFYPRIYTLFPSSILLGLTLGPMFCGQTTILMQLVSRLSVLNQANREKIQLKYLRLFYLFFNSAQIWGNLITALMLRYGDGALVYPTNPQHPQLFVPYPYFIEPKLEARSLPPLVMGKTLCESDKCGDGRVFRDPMGFIFILPSNLSLMLICVYLGMAFIGVALVTTLLDKLDMYIYQDPLERPLICRSIKGIARTFVDSDHRCLLPMVFLIGLERGFITSDFTMSYVSCSLGLDSVGFTMLAMGVCSTVGALLVYHFSKYIRRPLIVLSGLVFQSGLLLVLWLWKPAHDDLAVYYVIATGWGLCSSIWESLTITYVATKHKDDWQSHFASYFMVQALGLAVSYGYSFYLCTWIKVIILATTLAVVVVPYSLLEINLHKEVKSQETTYSF